MTPPLSLTVIAEGVESAEHLELLKSWICDEVQGYHIARTMPLEDLKLWLENAPYKK